MPIQPSLEMPIRPPKACPSGSNPSFTFGPTRPDAEAVPAGARSLVSPKAMASETLAGEEGGEDGEDEVVRWLLFCVSSIPGGFLGTCCHQEAPVESGAGKAIRIW